jgi:hypothetical protein
MVRKCGTAQIFGNDSNKPNFNQEEIKGRLNTANACNHSVQNISVFSSADCVNIKIYKTIILPVVLYGCETLSLAVRQEHTQSA